MAKDKILILGAGLAGLSAAWHLQRRGRDCKTFEKEPEVGGLCRSKRIDGFTFDYDGHLLHFKYDYTFKLVEDILGDKLRVHKRNALVYSHGKYLHYPFQANLYGLPSTVIKECLLGFIRRVKDSGAKDKKELNFFDWINETFGEGIARHFMIPYNTKFWTVKPNKLTCGWLDGFIPIPSLSQVIEGTIEESQREFGYNARFWYPRRGGINQLPLAFASSIKNIHTGYKVAQINIEKKEVKFASGDKENFDYLISTIPLPEMGRLINGLPDHVNSLLKKLRWNSIFNLNLGLSIARPSPGHWVYFPQKDISFFRVGFPCNFSTGLTPSGKSSLYVEVSYSEHRPIDRNKIIPRTLKDLKKIGIIEHEKEVVVYDANDIKYGYPIYDSEYYAARDRIIEYFTHKKIILCGRYGSWRYMSMEDVILDGKNVADLCMRG